MKKNEEENIAQISLKLPKTLRDELLKKADLLGLNQSKVLRQALEAYLDNNPKTPVPEPLMTQIRFLAQVIQNVDNLDHHKDLIQQQAEVLLECLTVENRSQSLNG